MYLFTSNFTLQDILGATLAFCLFPLVIVFPGYVTGWAFDLFDFRQRQPIVRFGIGLILSFAVSPIVLDLTSSLFSLNSSLITVGLFAAAFAAIILKEKQVSALQTKRGARAISLVGAAWAVFAILSQVDIQWKDQVYFSMVSIDQTMRVSVIDAMTRTGVPPINPSYYPGHPVQLTFLYYFWYILGSMIDLIGGVYVDARAALNASASWAGIGLIAVIALYLRLRNTNTTETAWRTAKIGTGLLAVSGLDALPIIVIMLSIGTILGTVEIWNTVIAAWVDSLLYVPHHAAALIAGLGAVMLAHYAREKSPARKYIILAIAGFGFASAFGLSIWVTLAFVAFWCIWIVVLFSQKAMRNLVPPMILAGFLALLLSGPFLAGLLQSEGGVERAPIIFQIREFLPLEAFEQGWSPLMRSLVNLAFLPVNYIFELGFYFVAGIYWFKIKDRESHCSNPFYLAEILMLGVVLMIGSCLRSNVINNDLGWRAWLPGQFVLLVWGVDLVEAVFVSKGAEAAFNKPGELNKIRNFLRVLIAIGVLTSTMDAVFQRILWPVKAGLDIGRQSYAARLAYDYLRNHIPARVITQNNPLITGDRPSGLYGTHQMVISDRSPYGIPRQEFDQLTRDVGSIFTNENMKDWQFMDRRCREHAIDILIFNDIDPVWGNLANLRELRPPLYENSRYALYACGDYAPGNQ